MHGEKLKSFASERPTHPSCRLCLPPSQSNGSRPKSAGSAPTGITQGCDATISQKRKEKPLHTGAQRLDHQQGQRVGLCATQLEAQGHAGGGQAARHLARRCCRGSTSACLQNCVSPTLSSVSGIASLREGDSSLHRIRECCLWRQRQQKKAKQLSIG